jgi:glycosyltransferase involved in cell wall biosynthesis
MALGVVVPVHDRRENLEILLASLLNQTYDDLAVVIADDGSTDGTRELVTAAAADPAWRGRLRWIGCGPHQGVRVGRARNIGAANLPADVEFMVMLDSDLVLQPDALAQFADGFARHPDSVQFGPLHWLPRLDPGEVLAAVRAGDVASLREHLMLDGENVPVPMPVLDEGTLIGPEIRFSLFGGLGPVDPDEPLGLRPYWMIPPNSGWPLDIFRSVGGFDERLTGYGWADFDLGVRVAAAGVTAVARPELWALHVWHTKDLSAPEESPVADLRPLVQEHGMAAEVFLNVRGVADPAAV